MSSLVVTFEVLVKSNMHVLTRQGHHSLVKMYHIDARTHDQAREKAKKYGEPVSVQKADPYEMFGDIEKLPIQNEVYMNGNPYNNAVAMDEMIWQKRNKRRSNIYKDKKNA